MKEYKNPFSIRPDHINCPLPLALESYWNCSADCYHCVGRKLNEIWGQEQRCANPENVEKKLNNALKNKNPQSPMAVALKKKKTLWLGRKSDSYQPLEESTEITRNIIASLKSLRWSYVVRSKFTDLMHRDIDLYKESKSYLLIEITPGGEKDWELFERKRTTPVEDRLRSAKQWMDLGLNVGVRGEPFIPGYHTTKQFKEMLKRLKAYGIKSYNTYNLHLNPHNAKRLHKLGLDIERIWEYNQDKRWKPIQQKLCNIALENDILLGCPDFVNVPKGWKSRTNTCCGISVCNPFKFNTHFWRRKLQKGISPHEVLENTWEGIGTSEDKDKAEIIIHGKSKYIYTMKDAEL